MQLMPIRHIDDWEKRIARQDAFWDCEILDRPVVTMTVGKDKPVVPYPAGKEYATWRDKWMDSDYIAACAAANAQNVEFLGDSLPTANPNLGPEILSAFLGAELEFSESTSWSIPCLEDWADVGKLTFSEDNAYWQAFNRLVDTLLEAGDGLFYTGLTDFHPGADAIAAFRDPMQLNIDMIESPDEVRALVGQVAESYFRIFDLCYEKLQSRKQATTAWAGVVSTRKWYVPSNDFSCMISKEMFDDMFLPGIAEECRFMEANIYHLDGPDALRHLDSLLAIPELNAIQWVYGAGNGRSSDWIEVYQKCQAAGKGIQLHAGADELDVLMENLRPEGVWLGLSGASNREEAEVLIKKVSRWGA